MDYSVEDTWKMRATEALKNGCTINGDGPDFVQFPYIWKMKATEALRNGCTINGYGPDFVQFPDLKQ